MFRQKSGQVLVGMVMFANSIVCLAQLEPAHPDINSYNTILQSYCVGCHNDAMRTAGLSLQGINLAQIEEGARIWEKVLRKLNARSMPPSGVPRPDEAAYTNLSAYIESELDRHAQIYPVPGKPVFRRLNRYEYSNAVRDLFGVDFNFDDQFPADDTSLGFDNVGGVLTLSPLLVEKYIAVARKIQQQVLGDPNMGPVFDIYNLPQSLMQDDRMDEELPFGSRGGIAVQHHFPVDGEYEIQVRFQRNSRDYIRGLIDQHRLDVFIDNDLVKDFYIGGEKKGESAWVFSSAAQGDVEQEHYERFADDILKLRLFATAGTKKVSVAFLKEATIPEEPLYAQMSVIDYSQYKGGLPGVRSLEISGPYKTAQATAEATSSGRIFVCQPDGVNDEICAKKILTSLARRAYRRSPTDSEISVLMDFFNMRYAKAGFNGGIGLAIERMLAGPEFLFVMEKVPEGSSAGEMFQISDLELATRLALFLWASIPDETLLDVAESGQLREPQILKQQVARMLADPRSRTLIDSFASQWLALRSLEGLFPDGEIFPYFDDNLKQAFTKETEYFFEYVMRENRPLLELLNADYTFINERLARHYGIPDVYGSHFRRVQLVDDRRGGILSQGSILTATSYPNRTAPTIRGKWILQNILGTPPPPPPPNVPGLQERNQGKALSMRQAMEMHRANPVCASCHKVMDPLGFALENYDAVGRWRTVDAASGSPVDSSGALPDGTAFQGPREMKEVLIQKRSQDFVLTVVEKLLTYALGREILHTDAPAIRSIVKKASPDDYRLQSLVTEIVESTPFQMRRTHP